MEKLISFIIPVKNEAPSLRELYNEIIQISKQQRLNFEIIFIDDGSSDGTFSILKGLRSQDKKVKIIRFRGNFGKSAALQAGFSFSKGETIITLDGDLQDNPKDIPKFLEKLNIGYDLVSGWKKRRLDPLTKVIPSRILNFIAAKATNVKLHDLNCGFKAYKREVIENLNLYGEIYRFIPIIAAKQHFLFTEVIVDHRKRLYGKTNFGADRFLKGFIDLITIIFLTGFNSRPGHFFGSLGLFSFGVGFIIGLYISYLRFTTGSIQYRQPLLFLGILLLIIGIQLISTGLLAEMIIYSKPKTTKNFIKETVGF